MSEAEVEELPKAIVRRLIKEKLAQIASGGGGGAEVIVNKDAMAAFAESARIFIHYLSATPLSSVRRSASSAVNLPLPLQEEGCRSGFHASGWDTDEDLAKEQALSESCSLHVQF